jgi:hypothetical protein
MSMQICNKHQNKVEQTRLKCNKLKNIVERTRLKSTLLKNSHYLENVVMY